MVVHENLSSFSNLDDKPEWEVERDTVQYGHSTPQMAGSFACARGACRLVLTHFSPRRVEGPGSRGEGLGVRGSVDRSHSASRQGEGVCRVRSCVRACVRARVRVCVFRRRGRA